jgi:hypothetical protein
LVGSVEEFWLAGMCIYRSADRDWLRSQQWWQQIYTVMRPRFTLPVEKKYRRSAINGFIGFIGKFLDQK